MLQLQTVTLVCIDTNHPDAGARAMLKSMRHCRFGRSLFVSPSLPAELTPYVNYHPVKPFPHIRHYSNFVLHELHKYIDTPHCLIVQSDGFVRNPAAWTEEFLDYDYIGSPWPAWDAKQSSWSGDAGWMTGNGGFSLRSRKFLVESSRLGYVLRDPPEGEGNVPAEECEDWFCCMVNRERLLDAGIKFAPPELSARFSFEVHRPRPCPWPEDRRQTFGFHGKRARDYLHGLYELDVMKE